MLIQIILVVFFLLALIKVWSRFRRKEIKFTSFVWWGLFWVLAGVVVLLPDSTMYVARALGVGRGVDVIIYLVLALLVYLFFRTTVQIENLNRDLTKVTRRLALLEEEKKQQ